MIFIANFVLFPAVKKKLKMVKLTKLRPIIIERVLGGCCF